MQIQNSQITNLHEIFCISPLLIKDWDITCQIFIKCLHACTYAYVMQIWCINTKANLYTLVANLYFTGFNLTFCILAFCILAYLCILEFCIIVFYILAYLHLTFLLYIYIMCIMLVWNLHNSANSAYLHIAYFYT